MGFSPSPHIATLFPFLAKYLRPVQGKSSGLGLGVALGHLGHLGPPKTPHSLSPHQAYLRAVDVKILQQLVVVNEGIEAVKWLLEERSTLTSRCSSLASSQYSLVESQAASRRGSWDSLQDPNDRLDSISVGSYLDTLADDMDEYSQNATETAVASTPGRALVRAEQDWVRIDPERDRDTKLPSGARERLGKGNLGGKAWKAEADFENCKLNSKLHVEYDAHWRWLQSQDDVTFL
uniref:Leucine rich adaptor protein 1 n=1 Tax=Falco tinnunculus TaxID=100819 RepID=A0A8C4VAF6_FALTI